jgi:two-component system sensor histidine kinase DevS
MASSPDRKDSLIRAGLILAAELSLPVVLQRIVDLAAEVSDARYGALGVIDASGQISEFITTGLTRQQRHALGPLPRGRGLLGALIRDARPIRVPHISRDPQSVGFPPNHPPMESFLGAPVSAGGRVFGNIYLTEKRSAREFSAEDEETLVVLAGQAGVAIANAVVYEESQRRRRWLEAIRAITAAVISGAEAGAVLAMVAGSARELAGADVATIVSPRGRGEGLAITAASGLHADELLGMAVPAEGSVSGLVIRTAEAIVFHNVTEDARAYQPMVGRGEMGPSIFTPLRATGRAFGTLAVANRAGKPQFSADTLHLVETFADQAAVAIEYARAQRDLQRLAVMDDRERIATELHDGIIQSLFAVGMNLQAAASLADPALQERIETSVEEIDRGIRDLRNYIFGLRPGILADRQLAQAIEDLADDIGRRAGITVHRHVDPLLAAELSPRSADVVQLVREALSNVSRHADAGGCWIELKREAAGATLTVRDDGRGFDTSKPSPGQGLGNLHERAARIGGSLQVTSQPDQGTRLRFTLPL